MKVWVDVHLSPSLATWLRTSLGVDAHSLRDLGMREADDRAIFFAARREVAIVLTKDSDFVQLLDHLGPPPRILWLTMGNTSNDHVRHVLTSWWPRIVTLFDGGESLGVNCTIAATPPVMGMVVLHGEPGAVTGQVYTHQAHVMRFTYQ